MSQRGTSQGGIGLLVVSGLILVVPLLFGISSVSKSVDLGWVAIAIVIIVFGFFVVKNQMAGFTKRDTVREDIARELKEEEKTFEQRILNS